MTGNEIRKTFLRFFEDRGHRVVRSSSLVPTNDPTLLFTNAGMNQFKDVFLGLEQRDYKTATSCQKCVRAGGKHNDLENVGFTNRHHTFFEMLGNFSFGDYFKEQAIAYAMELVTSPKWYGIPLDKLYFTVFGGAEVAPGSTLGTDNEAADFWIKVGAPKDRVIAVEGLKENFWAMGDTGPCGPCSEIFYDMGPDASAVHKDCKFGCDCGRYVEIWNLVFMQFDRACAETGSFKREDGTFEERCIKYSLTPLPKPCVDTGMGLERVAAVILNLKEPFRVSNYDTDLFQPLISKASQLCGLEYVASEGNGPFFRIIADHSRAATFLISDGVLPSNEGRGYVLRKIARRAIRSGRMLGIKDPFMHSMAKEVTKLLAEQYPELRDALSRTEQVLKSEEARYDRTLKGAFKHLDEEIKNEAERRGDVTLEQLEDGSYAVKTYPSDKPLVLSGPTVFKLASTHGLSPDILLDEGSWRRGFEVDMRGYERELAAERERAKASWKGVHKESANPAYTKLADTFKTEPDFYFGTKTQDARIEAIITKAGAVNEIKKGQEAEIVLDRTSIYAESGGQVADTGGLFDNSESLEVAEVRGAYYPVTGLIAHRIVAKEDLRVGDRVSTVADPERRARNMRNHTATHLMNAALRNILGTHVKQAGSLVAPDHLRFDFSHFAAVDPSEVADIEQQVNEEIRKDLEIRTDIMNIDDALASGALAFFGDKYPEANVRVVTIPDGSSPRGFYSKELCGGTHVVRTGGIGVFKIVAEQSIAAGVRRIEAITGDRALAEYQHVLSTLRSAAGLLNVSEDQLIPALERQLDQLRSLEKQLEGLKRKAAGSQAEGLLDTVREVKGVKVLAAQVTGTSREALRQMVDSLRQKLGSGVVVLATVEDGKVALIAGVTKDLTQKLHAGKIVQELAKQVGGSGGGKPDLAEAGGKDTSAIESTLRSIYPLLDRLL